MLNLIAFHCKVTQTYLLVVHVRVHGGPKAVTCDASPVTVIQQGVCEAIKNGRMDVAWKEYFVKISFDISVPLWCCGARRFKVEASRSAGVRAGNAFRWKRCSKDSL